MAVFNLWSFRGTSLNGTNIRITQLEGVNALPPLRGDDFLTMGRTGRLFVPKLHDSRRIGLHIKVVGSSGADQTNFDTLSALFANRAQGALVYSDGTNPRTAQAECVSWTPAPADASGRVWSGVADFLLADPWMYGVTVSGTVTPNAGLAFATPVINNISGPRTTWTAALTGVTSGQPIIVAHATQGYTTALTSIADNFATPYTWTRVDGSNTYRNVEIYIGTGGVGTSGTVTVTAASGNIGGFAIPLTGASTSAGLGAVDVHGSAASAITRYPTVTLTPAGNYGGMIMAAVSGAAMGGAYPPPTPSLVYSASYLGTPVALATGCLLIPAAAPFSMVDSCGTSWDASAAVIKGSGAPVTLNLTNPGSALAEKITIDFLGPIINPTVTNTTNGSSVTINTTVAGTKHLLVDTGAFTALNDGTSVIGSLTHQGAAPFLTLSPGVNALQISGSAGDANTRVTVSFLPPYE